MNKVRIALAIGFVVLSCQLAQAAPPLADRLPEGTLVYCGMAPASTEGLVKLLEQPDVKPLVDSLKAFALSKMDNADEKVQFEQVVALALTALKHPAAVALIDVQPPAPNDAQPAPKISAALILDLEKDKDAFAADLKKLLAAIKDAKFVEATTAGVTYQQVPMPQGNTLSFGFAGNMFFLTVGDKTVEALLALADGKGKSLAANPTFAAAMKEVGGESPMQAFYVDAKSVLSTIKKFVPEPETPAADGPPSFWTIVRALGLDGVTTIVAASAMQGGQEVDKLRIASPAPHRGILTLLAGKPLGKNALDGVPADADIVLTLNLSPTQVLEQLRASAKLVEPRAAAQIDSGLAALSGQLNLDIEKDLLASVGDQWMLVSAQSLGGLLTGTGVVIELKDAKKFGECLVKLETFAKAMLNAPNMTSEGQTVPAAGVGPKIASYKVGDLDIHYLTNKGASWPVAPAWAVVKNRLYVAGFPQVVETMALGGSEKPLAGDARFAALRKLVAPEACGLSYVNPERLLRMLYGVPLAVSAVLSNMPDMPNFPPTLLPALPKLEKFITPSIGAISNDDKGVTLESTGGFSGASLAALPMTLAVALPALGHARENVKKTMSATHLSAIGKALQLYFADNNDQWPGDLTKLVEKGLLTADCFYSPLNDHRPTAGAVDVAGKPIGPIDYEYLGGQFDAKTPPDLLVAYDTVEMKLGGGCSALFVDGSVRRVTPTEFTRLLAKTQEYLKEHAK
jgi:hypothetical protein